MSLRRYKLASTISATGTAQDSFVAGRAGKLKQIIFNFLFYSITNNASCRSQISRAAVSDFLVGAGAVTQALGQCFMQHNFVTSGADAPTGNYVVNCDDPLRIGDTLYLNSTVGGTLQVIMEIILVVEEAS